MEEDILQQIVYNIQSGLGEVKEESREFRLEAERQNFSMSKFMTDLSSKFFVTQNKQQADLNDSMDEVERNSAATNQNINELQSITQESVSILSQISIQMKEVAQGIGSLVQLFQQSSGANQFSFGGMVGQGLGALVGGAAITAAVGTGLSSLTDVGSAEAGQVLPSGGGNSDTGGSGQTLSVAEMVKLAKQAGFSDQEAAIMGAIGAAESSGNPKAHNPDASTGDNTYGLCHSNMLGKMGPERRKQFDIENDEQLWDPNINAKAARRIWEQQGFEAWSVYKSGAYKQYLGTAQEALKGGGENTNVEASKEEDGRVVNKQEVMNSMGSLNSKGELSERKGFVIHHTGGRGDVGGVVNTLNQRGFSVQYVIDREGKIHQLMPSGSRASHMKKGQGVGAGLSNSNTEGVEIIAKDDSDVLPVQVEAAKRLVEQLGYAPNQVYGHGEINPHKQRTEGSTVVSAIRGGTAPANPSETQSATGSTGLSGEGGGGQNGGGGYGQGETNPFAGSPFAGLTSQIAGALGSLTGFGQLGAGMLGGGGMGIMGAAMPMLGGLLPSMISGLSNIFSSSGSEYEKLSSLGKQSDAQPILQNDKTPEVSEMSNNLNVEKTVAELSKQEVKVQPVVDTSIQNKPVEGVKGATFTPTPSSSIGWVDRLGGRNKFPKSFNINGVYSA